MTPQAGPRPWLGRAILAVSTLLASGHVRPIGSAQQPVATPSPFGLPGYGEAA